MPSIAARSHLDDPVDVWAARQAATASFPDQRLNLRLAMILETLARKPHCSIPEACGEWRATKATYRFLENDRVDADSIIQPISDATARLCRGHNTIYAVQDTTSLTYSSLTETSGLGPLNDSSKARGIHRHSTLALREDGTPLGVLDQQWWARPVGAKTAKDRKRRPFEKKESYKWFRGIISARLNMSNNLPAEDRPRLVHVMDREGDIHEVLQLISASKDGAVIRAVQNRAISGDISSVHQAARQQPMLGTHVFDVPRKHNQRARQAAVELRVVRATITPNRRKHARRAPCEWTFLEVWEPNPPDGCERLHWRLWTTETITTLEQALAIITIYTYRWRIEEYHFCLKSGCRIEKLQLETAERLAKAIAIYGAIAARILALRDLGRRTPDAPCTAVLADEEWRVLWTHFRGAPPTKSDAPPSLRQATLWIGRLGGHLGRKRDGMPGVKTLWRGMRNLSLLIAGYRAGRRSSGDAPGSLTPFPFVPM